MYDAAVAGCIFPDFRYFPLLAGQVQVPPAKSGCRFGQTTSWYFFNMRLQSNLAMLGFPIEDSDLMIRRICATWCSNFSSSPSIGYPLQRWQHPGRSHPKVLHGPATMLSPKPHRTWWETVTRGTRNIGKRRWCETSSLSSWAGSKGCVEGDSVCESNVHSILLPNWNQPKFRQYHYNP